MTYSFPAILRYPQFDPVAFRLGPLAIKWYGLAYMAAFALGYLLLRRLIRRKELRISTDHLADLLSWLVVGVVAGGRLGWWLFYHRAAPGTSEPWWEPFAIWHGGMSFHGGLLGVLLAVALWTRCTRAPVWNVLDALALVTPIGLFLGRLANFINHELVGRVSNVPWAMIFPEDTLPRHPSQLYEAFLEGPLLIAALWLIWKKLHPAEGRTAALFLLLYGLFRFAVEFTRQPDPQLGFIAFGWLTMGQLLSLALSLAGIVLWILRRPSSPPLPPTQAT
jgi:phosphatidylglycerol:prolipoprotein diacylglycerol transferase